MGWCDSGLVSPDSGDTALRRRLPARSHNAPGLLYTAFPCQSPPHYLQRPRSLAGPDLLINKALSAACMGLYTRRLEQPSSPSSFSQFLSQVSKILNSCRKGRSTGGDHVVESFYVFSAPGKFWREHDAASAPCVTGGGWSVGRGCFVEGRGGYPSAG